METTSIQVIQAMSTRYSNHSEDWNEATETQAYNDAAAEQYEEMFVRWSDRCERWIRLAIVSFLVLLLLVQALLQWPLFRKAAVKVERLEGEPYKQNSGR
jgi:hypothetical protein